MEIEFIVRVLLISALTLELIIRAFAFFMDNKNQKRYLPINFFARLIVVLIFITFFTDLANWINATYEDKTGETFLSNKEMWLALLIIYPAGLIAERIMYRQRNAAKSREIAE